jgi:hypothetical protein
MRGPVMSQYSMMLIGMAPFGNFAHRLASRRRGLLWLSRPAAAFVRRPALYLVGNCPGCARQPFPS